MRLMLTTALLIGACAGRYRPQYGWEREIGATMELEEAEATCMPQHNAEDLTPFYACMEERGWRLIEAIEVD